MNLARELEHSWLISGIANQCGELYLIQQRLDSAVAAFVECHQVAKAAGFQDLVGIALYGMARTSAAQGHTGQAYQQGQECLAHLETIDHHRASEVQEWLSDLFAEDST